MTNRERFRAIARGELRGEVFLPLNLNYAWFMDETLERWHTEGLPRDADLAAVLGLQPVTLIGGAPYSPLPPFPEETLAEDDETRTFRDSFGVVQRAFKRESGSKMPQWLDHPIKSRADWLRMRERLDPETPGRYPADWAAARRGWEERDVPTGLAPGSFFGHTLQRWVGTENLCLMFYDAPALVEEMLEYLECFFLGLATRYLAQGFGFDYASFGEDIAYKGRAFISPGMFRRFLQPHYVRLCEAMRSHGIETIFVDSDGDISELIPLWLEVGINGFSPLEVAAGMDGLELRRKHGERVVLAGNIDKRALIAGPEAIDAEVERVRPLVELGQYFPAVDHSVPQDVPYDHFRYLVERLHSL
ncbi:MAG: uroporphyrinogen decarboxylase family protein [Armatimonadota bacterium]